MSLPCCLAPSVPPIRQLSQPRVVATEDLHDRKREAKVAPDPGEGADGVSVTNGGRDPDSRVGGEHAPQPRVGDRADHPGAVAGDEEPVRRALRSRRSHTDGEK